MRRHHLHLGARPLALLGSSAGSACKTSNWLGIRHQAECGVGHQGAGYGLRATRQTAAGIVSFRSGQLVRQPPFSAAVVAISDGTEHEPLRQLLGQFTDGMVVPEPEVGVGSAERLPNSPGGTTGHQPLPDASLQLGQAASIPRRVAAPPLPKKNLTHCPGWVDHYSPQPGYRCQPPPNRPRQPAKVFPGLRTSTGSSRCRPWMCPARTTTKEAC